MKKRIGLFLTLLLTVTAAVCLFTFSASAETYSGNCGKNGNNLTWSLNPSTGVLTISGKGEMEDYSTIDRDSTTHTTAPWGTFDRDITTVIIGDGVTNIGGCAFLNCSNISTVDIGDGLTVIGEHSFSGCSGFTSFTIPDGVDIIRCGAFCYMRHTNNNELNGD